MRQPPKYDDFPFEEICAAAEQKLKEGFEVYQKFSCGKCGQRLTMPENGKFHRTGSCDKCGHITNIEKQGCNYLLIRSAGSTVEQMMNRETH